MPKTVKLLTFAGYDALSGQQKAAICNGAGPAGDWRSALIPNTLYGLDCTEVFNIHDYCYHVGRRNQDKAKADDMMLENLMRLINCKGGWLAWFRRQRAMDYYNAVVTFGDDAFRAGDKDDIETVPPVVEIEIKLD